MALPLSNKVCGHYSPSGARKRVRACEPGNPQARDLVEGPGPLAPLADADLQTLARLLGILAVAEPAVAISPGRDQAHTNLPRLSRGSPPAASEAVERLCAGVATVR